jgi:hypothetical protein
MMDQGHQCHQTQPIQNVTFKYKRINTDTNPLVLSVLLEHIQHGNGTTSEPVKVGVDQVEGQLLCFASTENGSNDNIAIGSLTYANRANAATMPRSGMFFN